MDIGALDHILSARNIKPTAVRRLILREMQSAQCAMSVSDLENVLITVDKSTIFRTLTLFVEHHLAHSIDNGEGTAQYGLCDLNCRCNDIEHEGLEDLHLHFSCERCHKTYCLKGFPLPQVRLPKEFSVHTANYLLVGICPQCSKRK